MKKFFILIVLIIAIFYFFVFWGERKISEIGEFVWGPAEIIFVGDMMFDRHIRVKNEADSYQNILDESLLKIFKKADLVVGNLEGTITNFPSVSRGSAVSSPENFIFTFEPEVAHWLYEHNFHLVNLGNNHIDDLASVGISQTEKNLNEAGVSYFGLPNKTDSYFVKKIKGREIAFVNYNDFDSLTISVTEENIKQLKEKADFVVVYTHWGEEYKGEASARVVSLAHRFVDAGADLIIGSHPHVIQNSEEYNGSLIYYSLGNFIFDQYFNDQVSCGLVLVVSFSDRVSVKEEIKVKMFSDGKTKVSQC